MSRRRAASYRFASADQWAQCLLHRLDRSAQGALNAIAQLGRHAYARAGDEAADAVTVDRHGVPMWRTDASESHSLVRFGWDGNPQSHTIAGAAAQSPRWIADRHWLWAFCPGTTTVTRYDAETLDRDLAIDVARACPSGCDPAITLESVVDIATDAHDGLWILAHEAQRQWLLHIDCQARAIECRLVACEAGDVVEIASAARGRTLILLHANGRRVTLVAVSGDDRPRTVLLAETQTCFTAARLASDGDDRVALWDAGDTTGKRASALLLLDASGDVLDGPLDDLFFAQPQPVVQDIAPFGDIVYFATTRGLWCIDASAQSGTLAAESTLTTPALMSPPSDAGRGWLRAELDTALPDGAALEAWFATTDDDRIAEQATRIAQDRSMSSRRRQQVLWDLLDAAIVRRLTFTGPTPSGLPVAIPLFEAQDRWLWLGVRIVTPPGVAPPAITALRVLYPDVSLAAQLPGMFKGEVDDPNAFLRRVIGVLETTTEQLDNRIRTLGANVAPDTAPPEWLDFLASWLDLPWDDALPELAKRAILQHAGTLIAQRGTREGLRLLLNALVDAPRGTSAISDVTVDYALLRVGGGASGTSRLPGLLAGASPRAATLGGKAVVGRARLMCAPNDCDPLRTIVPTIRVDLFAQRKRRRDIEGLVGDIVARYVPAGVRLSLRWLSQRAGAEVLDNDGYFVDARSPGTLGDDSVLGRVTLGGRRRARLDESGLDLGFQLQ